MAIKSQLGVKPNTPGEIGLYRESEISCSWCVYLSASLPHSVLNNTDHIFINGMK